MNNTSPHLHARLVGTVIDSRYGTVVMVDHRKYGDDLVLPARYRHDAEDGDKVVVEIIHPATRKHPAMCKVLSVLGRPGEHETEIHAILNEFGLPYSFPSEVTETAEHIAPAIDEQEILRRRDMRDVLTFTIDPADAKDFDDALSFRPIDADTYEVGVHIADVSFYVTTGSAIDKEAYNRGTSVYLVDRTIPMLPEQLCNNLCSLRAGEDKLTLSVIFTIDSHAKVLKHKICRTIIRSNARLNYNEAQQMIEGESTDTLSNALRQLNLFARKMREERFKHGAIDFEHDEVKILVDEQGKVIGFETEVMGDSHHLIEEWMLLANRTVAEALSQVGKPVVYRVHDIPDREKIASLCSFAQHLGDIKAPKLKSEKNSKSDSHEITKALKRLLQASADTPQAELIRTLSIRAMPKAVYSTQNIGHYGLAFPCYTHFTSPIRRYPDLLTHRAVSRYLLQEHKPRYALEGEVFPDLSTACDRCSEREQLAVAAERASVKFKQSEWISQHHDEVFTGTVNGVTDYGVYVELNDTHCEGLLHVGALSSYDRDFWEYREEEYSLTNLRTNESIRIGDTIAVKVRSVDVERRQISFSKA